MLLHVFPSLIHMADVIMLSTLLFLGPAVGQQPIKLHYYLCPNLRCAVCGKRLTFLRNSSYEI